MCVACANYMSDVAIVLSGVIPVLFHTDYVYFNDFQNITAGSKKAVLKKCISRIRPMLTDKVSTIQRCPRASLTRAILCPDTCEKF